LRNTAEYTVTAEGRDKGKTFVITEMPASQGEDWAVRALGAMAKSGTEIPPEFMGMGWSVIAIVGLKAILSADYAAVKPLLDEMMACVQIRTPAAVRALVETDIEDIQTRAILRDEVFRVHAGFSIREYLSSAMMASTYSPPDPSSSDTETFPEAWEASSLPGKPA
jgi:hypothetical protein